MRTARIVVRVDPVEASAFQAAARLQGLSVASWLRAVALDDLRREAVVQTARQAALFEAPADPQMGDGMTLDQWFDRVFWREYPRKVGKHKARIAMGAIMSKAGEFKAPELANAIIRKLRSQRELWQDPQFIPHPTTWIHGRRWEDAE